MNDDYIDINGTLYEAVEELSESKWHDFTKVDYYGYAGALDLPDGSKPKLYTKSITDTIEVNLILSGSHYNSRCRRFDRLNSL